MILDLWITCSSFDDLLRRSCSKWSPLHHYPMNEIYRNYEKSSISHSLPLITEEEMNIQTSEAKPSVTMSVSFHWQANPQSKGFNWNGSFLPFLLIWSFEQSKHALNHIEEERENVQKYNSTNNKPVLVKMLFQGEKKKFSSPKR